MPAIPPSPYRVLDVPLSAAPAEIVAAHGRAIRARRYSRTETQAALSRLRNPEKRADQDLREVDLDALVPRVLGAVEEIVADGPAVADGLTLPTWRSLVVVEATGADRRDVPEPDGDLPAAGLLDAPPSTVLPAPDIPLPDVPLPENPR